MAAENSRADALTRIGQFLTDVVTAAGLLSHGRTDKKLATRISDEADELRKHIHLLAAPPVAQPAAAPVDERAAFEAMRGAAYLLTNHISITHVPVGGVQRDRTWIAQNLLDIVDQKQSRAISASETGAEGTPKDRARWFVRDFSRDAGFAMSDTQREVMLNLFLRYAPPSRSPAVAADAVSVGLFVRRSMFGPWIEVANPEPGAVRLYRAAQAGVHDRA